MLPQTHWHSRYVILILLFFIVFFLCSWTLAASIVESRAVLADVTSDPEPLATTPQGTLSPEPNQNAPINPTYQVQPEPSETPIPASPVEEQVPADPSQPPPVKTDNIEASIDLQDPVFSTGPYSREVLRGKGGTDKRIALTFDDGPVANWTDRYLAILTEKKVLATFFFVGCLAEKSPDIVSNVVAAGHDIGVHSHTHRKLTNLKEPLLRQDLVNSATIIQHIVQQPIAYFRPPYGATNSKVAGVAHELGQTVITWNVDPRDWDTKDSQQIVTQVLKQVRPGSIILLHEGKPQTLQALPVIIDRLRQEGYEFVTVSDLFGFTPSHSVVPSAIGTNRTTPNAESEPPTTNEDQISPVTVPLTAPPPPDTGTSAEKAAAPTNSYVPLTQPPAEPSKLQ